MWLLITAHGGGLITGLARISCRLTMFTSGKGRNELIVVFQGEKITKLKLIFLLLGNHYLMVIC